MSEAQLALVGVSLSLCGPVTSARCHCNPKCLSTVFQHINDKDTAQLALELAAQRNTEQDCYPPRQPRRMRASVALFLSLGLVTAGAHLQPRQTATIPDFVTKYGEESNH